jgi:2-dehydro-3-deoxyphosphogluconate aldolase/(4S)-4-hydroxy-2-oxoglutarate aldolase
MSLANAALFNRAATERSAMSASIQPGPDVPSADPPEAALRRPTVLPPRALVAILRAPEARHFERASQVLREAGVDCHEYTLTSDGALTAFESARQTVKDAVLGVGSVRTVQQLQAAKNAGADFAVSQVFLPELVDAAADLGLCYIPGALTPSEILSAWNCGVPVVKVSPVGPLGGPSYFREIFLPMPDVALMPTGGVTLEAAAEYLRLGAVAVGVSGFLFGDALLTGEVTDLKSRAEQLVSSASHSG